MALYALIIAYSVAGSIYLFQYGQFHFFLYPDYALWGGFGMAVAAVCLICLVAFSTNSYMLTRLTFFLWPLILVLSAARAGVIIYELNRNKNNFLWECNNGRLQYTEDNHQMSLNGTLDASSDNDDSRMPGIFCNQGWSSVYTAFVLALVIDLVLQLYGYFLNWRFKARIEHRYRQVAKHDGLYQI